MKNFTLEVISSSCCCVFINHLNRILFINCKERLRRLGMLVKSISIYYASIRTNGLKFRISMTRHTRERHTQIDSHIAPELTYTPATRSLNPKTANVVLILH
jgi:hypothetical protein